MGIVDAVFGRQESLDSSFDRSIDDFPLKTETASSYGRNENILAAEDVHKIRVWEVVRDVDYTCIRWIGGFG